MNIATFPAPSLVAQSAELKREKAMRARVYPHWIATGKIKREAAEYQNRALEAAIATIDAVALGRPVAGAPVVDEVRAELAEALRWARNRFYARADKKGMAAMDEALAKESFAKVPA